MSYETSLACLCKQCARLSLLKRQVMSGKNVQELEEILFIMEYSKKELLKEKEAKGYTDGLDFMEDNNFMGFSVKEGSLVGNTEYLLKICIPWYESPKNNYQFEVANYLMALYLEEHSPGAAKKDVCCKASWKKKFSLFVKRVLKKAHGVFFYCAKRR